MASAVISFSDKHAAEVNRKALARADPAVEEVVVTVAHSAIYAFEQPRGVWIKLDHEGPLFVVRRSSTPTYRIVLMNRLSTTNFMLDLTADVKVDRKDSLAILHLPNEGLPGARVFGFWSHSAPELTALVAALRRTVTDARSPAADPSPAARDAAPAAGPATSSSGPASTAAASDAIKGMLGIGAAPKPASNEADKKGTAAPGTRGAAQGAVGTPLQDALIALADDDAFMAAVARAYEKAVAAKLAMAAGPAAGTAPARADKAASPAAAANGSNRPASASAGGRGGGSRASRRSKGASKRAN
ncbi:hypothetical protein FNF29_03327 [Cafeteria roenbergensis]|uniref:WH1 domain-containing protein n=1 Tax=Cafeteria roenbergensis TaxID=33653 RepID=A0A5A8CK89_CAFRO|nr:hypothetical protein FNF29_03327 [Cafeteria roenbergensis]|eukprot:KAA0153139.1 hypothetical protein FNF29_03327 [Cafeteria roenbergensis]